MIGKALPEQLAEVETHIARTQGRITQQRILLDQMRARGRDTMRALEFLETLEDTLARHLSNRDRILRQLPPDIESPGPKRRR
jgi:hypothetical protein